MDLYWLMRKMGNMEIDQKYLPALGRVFSPIVLDSLAQKGYSPYLSEVCINSGLIERIEDLKPMLSVHTSPLTAKMLASQNTVPGASHTHCRCTVVVGMDRSHTASSLNT